MIEVLSVYIGFGYAGSWAGLIRRRAPCVFHYFYPAQLLQHHTAPVGRRAHRFQSTSAFAAVLVAQHAKLFLLVSSHRMRTKQPPPSLVEGFDRLLVCHRPPDQP